MSGLFVLISSSVARVSVAHAYKFLQRLSAIVLATLAFGSLPIYGQTATPPANATDFGSSAVGIAAAQTAVTFTVGSGGTMGTPLVLTQGTPKLDFQLGSGSTCVGSVTGGSCTVNVVFKPIAPGLRRGAVQLTDAAGSVIATAFIYGNGFGPRVAFTPGLISTVAGTGAACANQPRTSSCGDGGPATAAQFDLTRGITVDAAGNIFLVDTYDFRVRKIDAATGLISTVAGVRGKYCDLSIIAPTCLDGGPATQGLLTNPTGVAIDGAGALYITDSRATTNTQTNNIRKVTASTGIISTVASNQPFMWGITVDRAGDIYFSAVTDNTIRKLTVSTGVVTTVAGNGNYAFSGDGGPATSASFQYPYNVAVDVAGNLYIADFYSDRIRRVSAATGIITTIAGSGAQGYSGDGGPATNAALFGPRGVIEDGSGNLYFSDVGNNVIRKIDAAGIITTVAGGSTYGYTGDGGPAVGALIGGVYQVAVDSLGNLYIPDTISRVVRKVTATPAPVAFASTAVGTTSTDSPSTVTVSNTGTAALNFAVPASGINPAITAGYVLGSSGTCPQISASGHTTPLAAGTSCTEVVSFHPVAVSPTNTGSLTLTDDSLNVAGSMQTVALSGISTGSSGVVTPNINLTVPTTATPGATVGGTTVFTSSSTSAPTGSIAVYALASGSTSPIALTTVAATAAAGGSGTAFSFTAPATPGTYAIFASYAGDTNFNSANSSSSSLVVSANALTATTTNLSAVATATVGNSFPVTVRLGNFSSTAAPTGTVTLTATLAGGSPATIANLTAAQALTSGGYVVQATLPTTGAYTLTATYAGDANFSASSGSIGVNVKAVLALTNLYVPAGEPLGNTITGTLSTAITGTTAAPSGNITITAVHVSDGVSTLLATIPASPASSTINFTYTVPNAPGIYNVTASYPGDSNFAASTASPINFNAIGTPTISTSLIITIPASVPAGANFNSTLQLVPKSPVSTPPTGNIKYTSTSMSGTGVTLSLSQTPITAASAIASGGVQVTAILVSTGTYNVTASYNGDANYGPSSATSVVTSTINNPKLTLGGPSTITTGAQAAYTVNLTGFAGTPNAGILLTSMVNGTVGPQVSVSGTSGSGILTFTSNGTYTITANFAGDSLNAPATATFTTVVSGGAIPDFAIRFDDPSISTTPLHLTANTMLDVPFTITAVNGFTGSITLSGFFEQLDQSTTYINESYYSLVDNGGKVLSAAGIHDVIITPTTGGVHLIVHFKGGNVAGLVEPSPLRKPGGIAFAGVFAGLGLLGWRKRRFVSPRVAQLLLVIAVVAASGSILAGCGLTEVSNFRVTLRGQPNGTTGTLQTTSFLIRYNK